MCWRSNVVQKNISQQRVLKATGGPCDVISQIALNESQGTGLLYQQACCSPSQAGGSCGELIGRWESGLITMLRCFGVWV